MACPELLKSYFEVTYSTTFHTLLNLVLKVIFKEKITRISSYWKIPINSYWKFKKKLTMINSYWKFWGTMIIRNITLKRITNYFPGKDQFFLLKERNSSSSYM